MSEELQKPPVLDFDVLFSPISEESPSGENMRYSGLYDESKSYEEGRSQRLQAFLS